MTAHAMQLARAIRQIPVWPLNPADRAAWLRVHTTSFSLDGTFMGGRCGFPSVADFAWLRRNMETCLEAEDMDEHLSVEYVFGILMIVSRQAHLQGLPTEASKFTAPLEAQLLRKASRGPPSQLLPKLPGVQLDAELVPGTAMAPDRVISAYTSIASQVRHAGTREHGQRARVLMRILNEAIFKLAPAGHIDGDLAVFCFQAGSAIFIFSLDEYHYWISRSEELLPYCQRPTFGRNSLWGLRLAGHFYEGDFDAVLKVHREAMSYNSQAWLTDRYISAGASGDLLSVYGDHFATPFTSFPGCLLAIHGQLDAAEALLHGTVTRQLARVALGMPSAAHGDIAIVGMAWVAFGRGDVAETDRYLGHAVDAWRCAFLNGTANISILLTSAMPLAALLYVKRGEHALAAAAAAEFLKYPSWPPEHRDGHPLYGICCFVLGQAAAARGDRAAARDHLDRALVALRGPQHWLWAHCQQARRACAHDDAS